MRAYLELRILEAELESATYHKYGFPIWLPDRGRLAPEDLNGLVFQWTTLYDFNGEVTFPGSNNRASRIHANWGLRVGRSLPHFDQYRIWYDLPFPCAEPIGET